MVMKKKILVVVAVLTGLSVVTTGVAQTSDASGSRSSASDSDIKFGVRAGFNLNSQTDKQTTDGSAVIRTTNNLRPGFNVGGLVDINFATFGLPDVLSLQIRRSAMSRTTCFQSRTTLQKPT
jgi:hypothetical protein